MITKRLVEKYQLKLKGVGHLTFHLGCDFTREKDGTLCYASRKYIGKMVAAFKCMFKEEVTPRNSLLNENDHPELNTSDFAPPEDVTKYQSLIGSLQWIISLGCF